MVTSSALGIPQSLKAPFVELSHGMAQFSLEQRMALPDMITPTIHGCPIGQRTVDCRTMLRTPSIRWQSSAMISGLLPWEPVVGIAIPRFSNSMAPLVSGQFTMSAVARFPRDMVPISASVTTSFTSPSIDGHNGEVRVVLPVMI